MGGLDLFLSFELPKVDLPGAQEDVVGVGIEPKGSESVFRSIANLIKDGLHADVGVRVPNSYHFVSSQGDQVVPFFVEGQV